MIAHHYHRGPNSASHFWAWLQVVQEWTGISCSVMRVQALGAILPMVCLLTASLLIKPMYVMRYVFHPFHFSFLFLPPAFASCGRQLMRAGLGVLLVANVFGTLEYYRVPSKPDWRRATEYLVSRVRAEDKLAMIPGYESCAFKYNLSRLDHTDWQARWFSRSGIVSQTYEHERNVSRACANLFAAMDYQCGSATARLSLTCGYGDLDKRIRVVTRGISGVFP